MARKDIERSVVINDIKSLIYDKVNGEVKEEELTIKTYRKLSEQNIESYYRKNLKDKIILKVVNIEYDIRRYILSYSDFMKYAKDEINE